MRAIQRDNLAILAAALLGRRALVCPVCGIVSDGAAVVNLVLYWGKGHRDPWYLATSLGDARLAVDKYRQRMQPEQYFRATPAAPPGWLGRPAPESGYA